MSSVKDTLKHASIYSTAAMLGKMVSFLMLPFYAHILRDNGYAVIGLLDAGMALLVSMLAYGVRGSNVRLYHEEKDPVLKKQVISTGVIIIIAVSVTLTVPLMFFARPIATLLLDNPDYNRLFIMALIAFLFDMGGQGASSWLLIQSMSVKFAGINLLRLMVGLGLNIWLILFNGMGLEGFFISAMTISIMANSILMFIAFRDCGTSFVPAIARKHRDFLLPLIPGNLVSFASRQAERYLVKFQIDLASVGILEMGYKFPILMAQFVTTPFMQSWNTRRFEIADEPGASQRIGEMFTYYLFLVTFIGVVMAVIIKPVLIILTPPEFHPAYRIAQVEVLTMILNGAYLHLTFGLFYAKHTGTLAKIRGWTSAVKVGMAWAFISLWGIAGAAWSAAIIGAISVGLGYHFSQRQYRLEMEWTKLSIICGTALGIFLTLTHWDPSGTAVYQIIDGQWLPAINEGLTRTFLGTWKEGKLPVLLAERSGPVAEVAIKGILSALFGLLAPFVHDESRIKLLTMAKRLKS